MGLKMSEQIEYQLNSSPNKRIRTDIDDDNYIDREEVGQEIGQDVGKEMNEEDHQMVSEEANQSQDNEEPTDDMVVEVMVKAFKCSVKGCNKVMYNRDEVREHKLSVHNQQNNTIDDVTNSSGRGHILQVMQTNVTNGADSQPPVTSTAPIMMTAIQCSVKTCAKIFLSSDALDQHWDVEHKNLDQTIGVNTEEQTVLHIASDNAGAPLTRLTSLFPPTAIAVKSRKSKSEPIPILQKECEEQRKLLYLGQGKALDKQAKEMIINLYDYFSKRLPNDPIMVRQEVAEASRVGNTTICKTLFEYNTCGTISEAKKTRNRPLKFKINDEDRDILSRCVYKLKNDNRLKGAFSVFNEIKNSDQYNPTFKKCTHNTFTDIFKRYGFRVTESKIIDHKPADAERERMSCNRKDPTGEYFMCDWPACDKRIRLSQHMVQHLRTHTGVKPFVCRFANCQYRCAVSVNFTKHLKLHHKQVFEADDQEIV